MECYKELVHRLPLSTLIYDSSMIYCAYHGRNFISMAQFIIYSSLQLNQQFPVVEDVERDSRCSSDSEDLTVKLENKVFMLLLTS